jgi:glutathione synthase
VKICFLMYPWKRIDPESDTTLRLIHEASKRGHMVAVATNSNLTVRGGVAEAFCDVLVRGKQQVSSSIPAFYRQAEFRRKQLPLAGFDVIFMRCNPPLDNLALNFLDSVRSDTLIINDIDGLRLANNKLYPTSFYDPSHSFVPATHVSKNREYLERIFHDSSSEKMILKPLNSFGGQGVIVLEKSAKHNFRSLLDFYIGQDGDNDGSYVILQDYILGAEEGDVRILMLNGEAIGCYRRVPAKGDVRSNIHAGGSAEKHTLTPDQKKLCKYIGPKLVENGLYFVGVDVVGSTLLEVNVMSPGGITRINKLNRVRLQENVLDFVENVVNSRNKILLRKTEFRQAIEDAELL